MNVCPSCHSSADLEHHLVDTRCTRCGVSWPREDAALRVSVTVAEKPSVTVKAEECWKCGVVPGATCGWQPCPKGLSTPEGWDQHHRIGNCGAVALPAPTHPIAATQPPPKGHVWGAFEQAIRGRAPTYEEIGPWTHGCRFDEGATRLCLVADTGNGYGVWDCREGRGHHAATRGAADALLRTLYPPAVPEGIPVVSPTFGPVDDWPRFSQPMPVPASSVTRTEHDALVARLAVVEERTRPLGPVAPALGDHVEALKERAAVVAHLRKRAEDYEEGDDGWSLTRTALLGEAEAIEAGDHRRKS